MHDPAVRDATIVRQALSGVVVDLRAATEVICSRTPSQIQYFKQIYYNMNGVYLEHDIESRTSDDHKKVLILSSAFDDNCRANFFFILACYHLFASLADSNSQP